MVRKSNPQNAVILAAGFGMRMVPINTEVPKALLEVNGEPLIERIIKQLQEVGIRKIHVIVGFMKEKFAYLTNKYGVELVYNPDYAIKNNLHSLKLVEAFLSDSYIIPCDIWCEENPFRKEEPYSWYMVTDQITSESCVKVSTEMELVMVSDGTGGNGMIGISYLCDETAKCVREKLRLLCSDSQFDDCFWEETIYDKGRVIVRARVVRSVKVAEVNTYEQLRELDANSVQLESEALEVISDVLDVPMQEIKEITVLKKGMTNRSFKFRCREKTYIMRIPGEGTDRLINRLQESRVYQTIRGKGICDDLVYLNPENGYKITEYVDGVRVCDADDVDDLRACMNKLKTFHEMRLKVEHEFDLFGQIEYYESLWNGNPSIYQDYQKTKENVFSLKQYIDQCAGPKCLTHIDAVPDNFILTDKQEIQLIDWEYAGMQDPHVDLAMFCVYAMYDKARVDRLIGLYFEGKCSDETRLKIYGYIAVCGLLWSNWCEYKRLLGVEFGDYSIRQYGYAKEYYQILTEERQIAEGKYND